MINPANPSQYVFGAAGQISLNGTRIHPPADQPNGSTSGDSWFDATRLLVKYFINGQPAIFLGLLDVVTRQVGQPLVTVQHPSGGINDWVAGGGRWAAFGFDAGGPFTRIDGQLAAGIIVRAIGPDGSIAYVEHGSNQGLWLCPPERLPNRAQDLQLEATPAVCDQVRVYGRGQVSYVVGGSPKVVGLPGFPATIRTTVSAFGWFSVLRLAVGGRWGVLYQEFAGAGRCVLHPADDASQGYIVVPSGNAFRLEGALQPSGDRLIVYSRGEGDHPHEIRQDIVTAAAPMQPLGAVAPPPPPLPSPPTTGVDPMIRAFSHYGLVAPYFSHGRGFGFTPAGDEVGNAVLLVEDPRDPQVLVNDLEEVIRRDPGAILVLQGDGPAPIPDRFWNQTIALWCSGGTINELGAAVGRCQETRPELPILAYLDGRDWPAERPAWVDDRVRPNVQLYRLPGEPLETFRAAGETILQRVRSYGRPCGCTPRFDDFNGTGTLTQTLEAMPLYEHWVRAYQLVDFLPFADRRGQGMRHFPQLRAWARAFLYAFPERPNRYDYWRPAGVSIQARLLNKLGQSRLAVTLEHEDRLYLRQFLTGDPGPSPIPEPGPGPIPGPKRYRLDAGAAHFRTRWAELRVDEQTRVLNDTFGIHSDDEMKALKARDPAEFERLVEEYKRVQCRAMVQIAGELHHELGLADYGLNIKDGGNNWTLEDGRRVAADILAVLPTDDTGRVIAGDLQDCWLVDVASSIGGPQTGAGWDPEPHANLNAGRPWTAPPRP